LKARDPGRRDAPGRVLKDRRSPRERGRMGTSVNRNAPDVRVALFDRLQPLDGFIQTRVAAVRELFLKPDRPAAVPARLGHLIIRPAAVPRESHHRRAEVGVFLHQADDVRSQRRERRFGIRRRRRRLGRRGGLRGRVRGEPRVQRAFAAIAPAATIASRRLIPAKTIASASSTSHQSPTHSPDALGGTHASDSYWYARVVDDGVARRARDAIGRGARGLATVARVFADARANIGCEGMSCRAEARGVNAATSDRI